ncbi:MAG: hypothetical protein LBS40_07580, partial [Burkholderiales bacterium]|nr:hypothetical protein [Burkholderiales bacterium]
MIKTHFTTASLLLLLFFVLHTPIVHAYPSHRIALPNGEYIETNEDLKVKVMGGYIIAKREWTNSRWYLTSEWADLKFTYDDLDNSVKAIDRAGAIYERNGEAWFLETKYRIQKTAVGYRWSDNQGAWATYGDEGKITAVGDRNLTRAVFTYDAGG